MLLTQTAPPAVLAPVVLLTLAVIGVALWAAILASSGEPDLTAMVASSMKSTFLPLVLISTAWFLFLIRAGRRASASSDLSSVGASFVPVAAFGLSLACFLLSWMLGLMVAALFGRSSRHRSTLIRLAAAVGIVGLAFWWSGFLQTQRLVGRAGRADISDSEALELFERAREREKVAVLKALAVNRNVSGSVLSRIVLLGWPELEERSDKLEDWLLRDLRPTLEIVAAHPNAGAESLFRLAGAKSPRVRRNVAENPRTPAGLLEKLAEDSDRYVRNGVAHNASAPAALLRRLFADQSSSVRDAAAWTVASRPVEDTATRVAAARIQGVAPDVLKKLSTDPDPEVRAAVAEQHETPREILETLATDSAASVRSRALATLALLGHEAD